MPFEETFRRRNLPHWEIPGATYFITSCLEGSIPARGLLDTESYVTTLDSQKRPPEMTLRAWESRRWKLIFARLDRWLDREPAARHLDDPVLARKVMNVLLYFGGQRYDVYAFVVMPSHFHWVFRPRDEWVERLIGPQSPRERIMKNMKSYSSRQCNLHRGRSERFWQEESYDHWTRDADELSRIMHYVENNPVSAGLVRAPEEWPFSSARLRAEHGGIWGDAIVTRRRSS
jgi:putative transposase